MGSDMAEHDIAIAKAAAARGEFERAIRMLRPLAEAGDREARYQLGLLALTDSELVSGREAFALFMEGAEEGHGGFDSPESAALAGYSPKFSRVLASRSQGDDAYVLVDTVPGHRAYLYGVNCRRRNGRWIEGSSGNRPGWDQTGHDPDVGTLSYWDDAPAGAEMVRVEFDGRIVDEAVSDRGFLVVWWRVPAPQTWPRVLAFRIGERWIDWGGVDNS